MVIDKQSGCITVSRNRAWRCFALNSCGNQLQFFKDTPKQYDAWNIDPGTLDVPPATIDRADSVELVGAGTQYPAVRVTSHWQSSKFVQTISLTENGEVDIDNDIDWHEKHVLLKAAFPLSVKSDFATYEIPYGAIERPTTRNNSWEKAQFEVPAMRWADLSGTGPYGNVHGLSVLNQDKYGYDAVGNVLRLTCCAHPRGPTPMPTWTTWDEYFVESLRLAALSPPRIRLSVQASGNTFVLSWPSGTLQSTSNLAGPWYAVPNAAPPSATITPAGTQQFYRAELQ